MRRCFVNFYGDGAAFHLEWECRLHKPTLSGIRQEVNSNSIKPNKIWCPRQDLNLSKDQNNGGNPKVNAQRDAQRLVPLGRDLTQVVSAWAKLSPALKAAILAIAGSVTSSPEDAA